MHFSGICNAKSPGAMGPWLDKYACIIHFYSVPSARAELLDLINTRSYTSGYFLEKDLHRYGHGWLADVSWAYLFSGNIDSRL